MGYRITFKKSVARDLKKIDRHQADAILRKIQEELPDQAETLPVLAGRFSGLRKFRIGDYRVIFSIVGDSVIILRIGHRREIYRSK